MSLLTDFIEKNCWSGLEEFYTSLSGSLKEACELISSGGRLESTRGSINENEGEVEVKVNDRLNGAPTSNLSSASKAQRRSASGYRGKFLLII